MNFDELKRFLEEAMDVRQANYQPVFIKTLLHSQNYTASKEKISQELEDYNPGKERNFKAIVDEVYRDVLGESGTHKIVRQNETTKDFTLKLDVKLDESKLEILNQICLNKINEYKKNQSFDNVQYFLVQVSDFGSTNLIKNKFYEHVGWQQTPRDKAHGEVKVGDLIVVYFARRAIDFEQSVKMVYQVESVTKDNVRFNLSTWKELKGIPLSKIRDSIEKGVLGPIFNKIGEQGFNITQITKADLESILSLDETKQVLVNNEKFRIGHELFKLELSQREHKTLFENFNHPDLLEDEINFKKGILENAIPILSLDSWLDWKNIPGKIFKAVRDATAIKVSKNLVWAPPHHTEIGFFDEMDERVKSQLENEFFDFFKGGSTSIEAFGPRFDKLVTFFEKNNLKVDLRLLSYLAFLLDPTKYFLIHPSNFDKLLEFYEIPLIKEKGWEKYFLYLKVADELRSKLVKLIPENELSAIQIQSYMWVIAIAVSRDYWMIRAGRDGKDWENQKNAGIIGIHYYTINLAEFVHSNNQLAKKKIIEKIQEIRASEGKDPGTKGELDADYGQLEDFFSIGKGDKIVAIGNNSTLLGIGDALNRYQFRTDISQNCHTVPVNWYDTNARTIPQQSMRRTLKQLDIKEYIDLMLPSQTQVSSKYKEFFRILDKKNQFIFYGPPGTGKTYTSKIIAEEFVKQNKARKFSTDEYNIYVISILDKVAQDYNGTLEQSTKNLFSIKTSQKDIRIYIDFSRSDKNTPYDCYVGVSGAVIDFLNQTNEENRFIIVVNNDVKNFVVLPHSFIKKNVRLSSGENWDASGNTDHSFHIHVYEDHARYRANESSPEKYIDCSNYLNNSMILFDKNSQPCRHVEKVTFHQSFAYEEFIEGIRPKTDENMKQVTYPVEDGIFKKLCKCARIHSNENFVLIIDEINRGNISKIFGELITLIEKDKRGDKVILPYSRQSFFVPPNLYIIGTMNTADRSLVHIDAALKRRFAFYKTLPDYTILRNKIIDGINISKLLESINQKLIDIGMTDNQIGHSYFMDSQNPVEFIDDLQFVFAYEILPLLQEYFYDDVKSLQEILGEFIDSKGNVIPEWKDSTEEFKKILKRTYPEVFE